MSLPLAFKQIGPQADLSTAWTDFMSRELPRIAKDLKDKSRRPHASTKRSVVPLKFDHDGNPLSEKTFDARKHLRFLTLEDHVFLKAWRDAGWDAEAACKKANIPMDQAKRLVQRVQVFRDEEAVTRSLCEVPTTGWISAKHVENVYGGGTLNDSERDSLKELAKISGSYKNTTQLNIQQNVFNLPKLDPEIEAQFKALAEKALEAEAHEEAA